MNQTAAHAMAADWESALQAVDAAILLLQHRAPAHADARDMLANCRQTRDFIMTNLGRQQ